MAGDTVGHPVPERPGQQAGRTGGPGTGPQQRRRAPARLRWFLAAALLLPILELAVAIEVGRAIGALAVFALLVLGAALGMLVVRRQGSAAWKAVNTAARTGTPPSRDLADATVLMLAGILLIVPGFVTDLAAALLLLPFTRPLARRPVEGFFRRAAADQANLRTAYLRGVQFGPGTSAPGSSGTPGTPGAARAPGRSRFGQDDVIQGEVIGEEHRDGGRRP